MPPETPPTLPAATQGAPSDSLWRLLLWLPLAALKRAHDRLHPAWPRAVMSACGLVAMVSPLLLWVSWSKAVFLSVLGLGVGALALFLLLVWLAPGKHV